MVFLCLVLSVFLADQLLKQIAEHHLPKGTQKDVGIFRFLKVHNSGFAFGGGKNHPKFVRRSALVMIIILAVQLFISVLRSRKSSCEAGKNTGRALILGGALGNWFDRVNRGYVTDYFTCKSRFFPLHRFVFNLADFCIFGGILLRLFSSCRRR